MSAVTRICQTGSPYAPPVSDCQNALSAVSKRYPSYIFSGSRSAACSVISESGQCSLSLCAFPGDFVETSKYKDAVNDILNNCQARKVVTNTLMTVTGGYDIVRGTNFTFQVSGTYTPTSYFCTNNPSIDALTNDCAKLVANINQTKPIVKGTNVPCIFTNVNGTCLANICGPAGTAISGREFSHALSNIVNMCKDGGNYMSGTQIMDPQVNVSLYALPWVHRPGAATTLPPIACSIQDNSPRQSDCEQVANGIRSTYPVNITKASSPTNLVPGCSVLYRAGTCQAEYCALPNSTISKSEYLSEFNKVMTSCKSGTGTNAIVGGYSRTNGTNVVINAIDPLQNLVCNTASNNSPLVSDCDNAIKALDKTKMYTRRGEPCTIVSQSGKCKLNFCSPPNSTFSGQKLFDAASAIYNNCSRQMGANSYTSGILKLNPFANISLFDPPPIAGKTDYTTAEIRQYFASEDPKFNPPPPNTCWFYWSSLDKTMKALVEKANTNAPNNSILAMSLYDFYKPETDAAYPFNRNADPFKSYLDAGKKREWYKITSRAYAERCSGVIRFVWNGDTKTQQFTRLDPPTKTYIEWQTIWLTDEITADHIAPYEWNSILRVDPATGAESAYVAPPDKPGQVGQPPPPRLKRHVEANNDKSVSGRDEKLPQTSTRKRQLDGGGISGSGDGSGVPINAVTVPNVSGTVFSRGDEGFVPADCSFSLIQKQKPNPATDSYSYTVTVRDAQANVIGFRGDMVLPTGQSGDVTSSLYAPITFRSGAVDSDPVYWSFDSFESDTSKDCDVRDYSDGQRTIQCGFRC